MERSEYQGQNKGNSNKQGKEMGSHDDAAEEMEKTPNNRDAIIKAIVAGKKGITEETSINEIAREQERSNYGQTKGNNDASGEYMENPYNDMGFMHDLVNNSNKKANVGQPEHVIIEDAREGLSDMMGNAIHMVQQDGGIDDNVLIRRGKLTWKKKARHSAMDQQTCNASLGKRKKEDNEIDQDFMDIDGHGKRARGAVGIVSTDTFDLAETGHQSRQAQ